MIHTEDCRKIKIKRANTDWWINEKAIVGKNGRTYIAYVTDMGEIHVKEFDAKCSKTPSRDVCLCWLNNNFADEHNAPGMCIMEDGRIIVAYTGHSSSGNVGYLRYCITEKPYDIGSFGPEQRLEFPGGVTYVQLSENTKKHQLWCFTRVNGKNWAHIYSVDGGRTWSEPTVFLKTNTTGQTWLYYLDIRKLQMKGTEREYWFFAIYGHPRSDDHVIRAGLFDDEGQLLHMDGSRTDFSLFEDGSAFALSMLEPLYEAPKDTTVRLLEVSPTYPLRVGLAAFSYADPETTVTPLPETLTYYMARYRKETGWYLSAPICKGGEFLAPYIMDGAQTYVGGMACYYGVGDAGCDKLENYSTTDRVYIARFDGTARVLESYVTHDSGKTYTLEQTVRRIEATGDRNEEQVKIWRPIVPIHAQDNLPVYWHEGTYSAHTGGWHADVCAYVEYDD